MKRFIYILVSAVLVFTACDYLDMVPEKDIETIDTIFEKKEQAADWLRSCYVFLQEPVATHTMNPAVMGTDELVTSNYLRNKYTGMTSYPGLAIADGSQVSLEPFGNIWKDNGESGLYACIRYCNIFLNKIWDVYNMELHEKKQWAAEIKALKAMVYFELVRRYGPITLVPDNIEPNVTVTEMQRPRSPMDECFKVIVDLLDEALEDLDPMKDKDPRRQNYFSREGAAALKARVLLYAASPLFNGNEFYANFKNKKGELLFNPTYDREKWRLAAEAAEEAIEICTEGGKMLNAGNSGSTALRNTMRDIEGSVLNESYGNKEALFTLRPFRSRINSQHLYLLILPRHSSTYTDVYNGSVEGCVSPSMKMVEMYYTDHGLPIDADKEWNFADRYNMSRETDPAYTDVVSANDVLNLHLHREPRFYACIAADRCYWQRGTTPALNLVVTAYQGEKFGSIRNTILNSEPQNITGYWLKKHLNSNMPTIGYIPPQEATSIVIRMAELYLIAAEAWNEYEGPSQKVYDHLNVVRKRAGILNVEDAWRTYSITPDKINNKEGMREIIHREWDIEFAFEGYRFYNLRRWKIAHEVLNEKLYGWNVVANNARQFYNDFNGPIVVWSKRQFLSPRDYFFPIRSEEVLISSIVQNPGWGGNNQK